MRETFVLFPMFVFSLGAMETDNQKEMDKKMSQPVDRRIQLLHEESKIGRTFSGSLMKRKVYDEFELRYQEIQEEANDRYFEEQILRMKFVLARAKTTKK